LAAPGAPPPLPREKFAVVSQLHESAFQNTADALAGRRLGETGLHEALFDTLGLESSLVKPDDKPRVPATLWLSDRAPLQAQLRDGQVLLNVHFQSYEVDERRVDADFAVYATYALTIRDDRARADRQQIRVDSPDSAHAKPLGDLVDRFFPVYLASRAPHDNGNGGNGLGLRLTHLTVDDGWLNLGWEGTTPTSVATSPMR
jgi:hypothetical protein